MIQIQNKMINLLNYFEKNKLGVFGVSFFMIGNNIYNEITTNHKDYSNIDLEIHKELVSTGIVAYIYGAWIVFNSNIPDSILIAAYSNDAYMKTVENIIKFFKIGKVSTMDKIGDIVIGYDLEKSKYKFVFGC